MNSDYTLMKKKNIYILLLLAPVLFASCKVGKSYVRPEMALPDSLMQQQDSISIADERWQAVYTDNTLRSTTIPPKMASSLRVGSNTVFKISEAMRNSRPKSR